MKPIKCRDMPYLFGIQLSMQFSLMNSFMSHSLRNGTGFVTPYQTFDVAVIIMKENIAGRNILAPVFDTISGYPLKAGQN